MNFKIALTVLCLMPGTVFAATERTTEARIGVGRISAAASRAPTTVKNLGTPPAGEKSPIVNTINTKPADKIAESLNPGGAKPNIPNNPVVPTVPAIVAPVSDDTCRTSYRNCMNEFCLLDESEGARCACSSNINQSKKLIKEIMQIQADAEKLYTIGVEREKLGAKVNLVFGQSDAAKKSSRASGLNFSDWVNGSESAELGTDADIGDDLYNMARDFCAPKLKSCGDTAEMEEMLYSRMIVADCKSFDTYLADQKINAETNKKTADAAVRSARFEMLDTTNKYNRGECLLAYKSCVSDKGGCGNNFENCLDSDLLARRANSCENVLDQCMAARDYVIADWAAESKMLLVDAAKFADKNRRATCFAKIQNCLETGCSTATDSACLTNVNVAAGICPIIDECNEIIPGIKVSVNDKLGYMRQKFCQNDVDKCLQDKCGKNYNAPECLAKKTSEIIALCPQQMFPSCVGEKQFNLIVQSNLMQMDYQMVAGCTNYFGEQLGLVCGTDMSCLPSDLTVESLVKIPETEEQRAQLRTTVRDNSKLAVAEFFKKFEKDITVSACLDAKKPGGRASLGTSVFNSAKLIAEIGAENRALRALELKIANLSRAGDLAAAEKNCRDTYEVESPDKKTKNYSYIKSVAFEPALRNCHICRAQQVCETGGESKGAAGAKGAAGGLAAGAAAGTMVMPGWGTAIGSVVGGIGGLFAGRSGAGEKEFCQEIESCEDVNF